MSELFYDIGFATSGDSTLGTIDAIEVKPPVARVMAERVIETLLDKHFIPATDNPKFPITADHFCDYGARVSTVFTMVRKTEPQAWGDLRDDVCTYTQTILDVISPTDSRTKHSLPAMRLIVDRTPAGYESRRHS